MSFFLLPLYDKLFGKILSVIVSLMLTFGVLRVETRGDAGSPADPSAPYLFDSAEEYFAYYYRNVHDEKTHSYVPNPQNVLREVEADGFTARICKNGTAAITGLTKAMRTVRFPEQIEGCRVVAVDGVSGFFDGCAEYVLRCTSVIIPNTVEYIGSEAFRNMSFLQNVDFGERVKFVGDDVCILCHTLKSVKISGSIEKISGFAYCYSLTSLEICNGVRSIDDFQGCGSLKTVRFPDSMEEIGSAFIECAGLADAYIPASVTTIADNAFLEARRLTIHGVAGSYAERWAAEHGFGFAADY